MSDLGPYGPMPLRRTQPDYPDRAWFKIELAGKVVARTLTEEGAWEGARLVRERHPLAPLAIQYPADVDRVDPLRGDLGLGAVTAQVLPEDDNPDRFEDWDLINYERDLS